MAEEVLIAGGARTPFVRAGDSFKELHAVELGRRAATEALARAQVLPADVDETIVGCVGQPSDATNIGRVIALRAGVPEERPAHTVSRNCASGLEAVTEGFEKIQSGRARTVLVGGVESMSRLPLEFPLSFGWKLSSLFRARNLGEKIAVLARFRFRDLKPVVALERGLTDPVCGEIMGLTAERLAREFGISREEQDRYAQSSHERAVAARPRLAEEIAPVSDPPNFYHWFDQDIGPRENSSFEGLSRMRPYFDKRYGSVTIGNSCGITDGSAFLVLMSGAVARERSLESAGRIVDYEYAGCEPKRMGLGPVYATHSLTQRTRDRLEHFARVEINEAFAGQVIACLRAMGDQAFAERVGWDEPLGTIEPESINRDGGAIALGHPVGATGARLVLTLNRQLESEAVGSRGLATLCIGGGQGGAIILERWSA